MKTGLLLIDIQNEYLPGGRMELAGGRTAARTAARLLARCRERNIPVIHVRHITTRPGADSFLPGSEGIRFADPVRPLDGEEVISKHFPNSFRETGLAETLRRAGTERLVLCGMMSHMCVDATVRAAFDLGLECIVAHDACATRDLCFGHRTVPAAQVHAAFMAALAAVYARVLPAGEVENLLEAKP